MGESVKLIPYSGKHYGPDTSRQRHDHVRYPIGYFHIDIVEVRTEEGKLYLLVAIDRTSKFAFALLHPAANMKTAAKFLAALIKAVPTGYTS